MSGFIVGAAIVLGLWFFFSMRSRAKTYRSFNAIDEAETWLKSEGIKSPSLQFSSYTNPYLPKNLDATVLVCMGEKFDGNRVGFVLEVVEGSGVVESAYIEPYGIASHHKKAAYNAKMNGKYLIDALQEIALHHRLNNVQ